MTLQRTLAGKDIWSKGYRLTVSYYSFPDKIFPPFLKFYFGGGYNGRGQIQRDEEMDGIKMYDGKDTKNKKKNKKKYSR